MSKMLLPRVTDTMSSRAIRRLAESVAIPIGLQYSHGIVPPKRDLHAEWRDPALAVTANRRRLPASPRTRWYRASPRNDKPMSVNLSGYSKIKFQNLKTGMTCFILFILLQLFNPTDIFAAKKRVFKTTVATVVATKPTISVQIRKDRRAITVIFNNLSTTTNNDYELTYIGNNIEQGVVGSVKPEEGNYSTRLLLFGTCSHNTCSYHKNVNNTILKTTSKLKTGKTLIKTFKIKV